MVPENCRQNKFIKLDLGDSIKLIMKTDKDVDV